MSRRARRTPPPSSPRSADVSAKPFLRGQTLFALQSCFFLSGAAGLMYQVVWTKQLAQIFGYTTYAVATVLAVFMGGMALGSVLFGRWKSNRWQGIALYAWLELLIAVTALLTLPGIPLVRRIYLASAPHLGESVPLQLALRATGAVLALALPTILMGGTLPVLLAGITREAAELGGKAGRFYAANTGGAVAGTLAAGFFLIPWIGLRFTLLTAVFLNVVAGIIARRCAPSSEREVEGALPAAKLPEKGSQSKPLRAIYLACFALAGATAILYELGWTRLLATPLGSSTYAFSLMLGTFLFGIAAGSAIYKTWFRAWRKSTGAHFAVMQLAIGAGGLASLWLFSQIPELLLSVLRGAGKNFSGLLFAQAATCALPLLPLAMLFGFNFPLVLSLLANGEEPTNQGEVGSGVGIAVAANTGGAVLAAVLGGFVLLPWAGSFRVVAVAALLNVIVGAVLVVALRPLRWTYVAAAAVLAGAIMWTAASPRFFGKAIAAFGVVLYHDFHNSALSAREMADTEDVVFFKDGINATIAVARSENYVALKTDGKVDASNLDGGTQLMLGDLGAVFHPNPRRVLVVGFGGGMTVSAVARFPEVERVDCVEIEPAVVEAAPYLARLHRGALADPRLHLHFDDARNFLQTSNDRYDLIISEPSNPWIAGVSSLYTREFFQTVRAHLAPGGAFVQWVQAYGLTPRDLSMILGSLAPAFSDVTLWHSPGKDLLVLARDAAEPLRLDRARLLFKNDSLREDFAALHLTQAEGWVAYFRLGDREVRKQAADAATNTDDRTLLEYTAPRHLLDENLAAKLDTTVESAGAGAWKSEFAQEDATRMAIGAAETALYAQPKLAGQFLDVVGEDSPELAVLRARTRLAAGDAAGAAEKLGKTAITNPNVADYWLVVALRDQGQLALADSTLDQMLQRDPDNQRTLEAKVDVASRRQDYLGALIAQSKLSVLRPDSAKDYCALGDLFLRTRQIKVAEAPLKQGLERDSYSFLCHRDLGELYRATARNGEATRELEWVVRFFPEADSRTYASLALAYRATGDVEKATETLKKGRRIFPLDALLQELELRH